MAAKPIERFVKKQIAEQGGWPKILDRIASGETYTKIAESLKRPDGQGISFAFFRRLLHQDPARNPLIADAKRIRAEAWADDALLKSDASMATQTDVGKARVQIDARLRLAGFADREQFGERKQDVNVTLNVADIHLDSLRHRMVENSKPLEHALALSARADFKLIGPQAGSSGEHSEGQEASHAPVEQSEQPLTPATAS
jgi:hypothetical protein